jgi:hypothetical protein
MKRFVEGIDRKQSTFFPEYLDDWIDENNPVQVIDLFVDELDLGGLGFGGVAPESTVGRHIIPRFCSSSIFNIYGRLLALRVVDQRGDGLHYFVGGEPA